MLAYVNKDTCTGCGECIKVCEAVAIAGGDKMIHIIGQVKSSIDMRKVMDEGKILLINLAKGKTGEENSNFLGLILVPKILIAAMTKPIALTTEPIIPKLEERSPTTPMYSIQVRTSKLGAMVLICCT